jgi:guanine nucleotide-binding protein G(i) subunit alpha
MMADPVSVIGAAGSILGILEVLCKSISTLHELHSRWKEAEFTFINLVSQLTALKAALYKLQEWIDSDIADLHHQLVIDLDVSITCCRMLVGKIDTHLSEMNQGAVFPGARNTLGVESKIKLVFKSGELEDLQKMLERQTNALTLLLTACNWCAPAPTSWLKYISILSLSQNCHLSSRKSPANNF